MLVFKLPFEDKIFTIHELNSQKAVQFFSFDGIPEIEFSGEICEIEFNDFPNIGTRFLAFNDTELSENQSEYLTKIEKAKKIIQDHQLRKLVVARKKQVKIQDLDLAKTFQNLIQKYPSAFIYFFEKNGVSWMGAFSEVLGKFDKKTSEFQTMSLAGTLPVNDLWSDKEIEEQKPVTDYLAEILKKYATEVFRSETYDHISGNIKHLRTDFRIKIKEEEFDTLISELHPTPAVCGIPKEDCKNYILDLEKFDRELYAGYSRIETETEIFCFVNLRCAKLFRNKVELFAGGGITTKSNPEKEWQETELKMQALENNFIFS